MDDCLKPGEIRIAKFGKSAVREIVQEYLLEHYNDLFDLDDGINETMLSINWNDASSELVCVLHRCEDFRRDFFDNYACRDLNPIYSLEGKIDFCTIYLNR